MNPDALLKEATEGRLGRAGQQQIADALASRAEGADPYVLLLALGRAMATQHRAIVESFLHEHRDPMLVRLALQVLCKFWGETSSHLERVRELLVPQPWDVDGDARQMAISVAGEYLRGARDRQLLESLLTIVTSDSEDEVTRSDAYLSVARAMGRSWDELPRISRLPPLQELVDPNLIEAARARCLGPGA